MAIEAQYRLRVDSAADWTSNDPTLLLGEIGLENDTEKMKIGDGSTAWTSLGYAYHTPSEMTTISGDLVAVHHTRSHAITGTSDHTAGTWKAVYTDGSGDVQELALGSTAGTILSTNGAAAAPTFIDHGGISGLGDDDHTLYIKSNGNRAFSATISGVTPTDAAHLTRKDYVDGQDTTISGDLVTGYTAADAVVTAAYTAADTTISGDLSSEIDSDISTHEAGSSHDSRYYTESEIDSTITTVSGDLVAQHHTQSHAITSTSDHTAGNWKVTYTNGSGEVIEVALGASGTVLTSQGAGIAPIFV